MVFYSSQGSAPQVPSPDLFPRLQRLDQEPRKMPQDVNHLFQFILERYNAASSNHLNFTPSSFIWMTQFCAADLKDDSGGPFPSGNARKSFACSHFVLFCYTYNEIFVLLQPSRQEICCERSPPSSKTSKEAILEAQFLIRLL
jgi:hypothetical protein